jgi:hypothetical protein
MKYLSLVCVAVCILIAAPASHAQEPTGTQIEQYTTIAGGWWLNRKCSYLADNLRKEFEWHVAKLTAAFRSRGMEQAFLNTLQNSARKTAMERKCASPSSKIVIDTVLLARRLNREMTGAAYDEAGALIEYQAKRFLNISAAAAVERICQFGPAKGRATFLKLTEALATKVPPPIAERGNQLQSRVRNAGLPCNAKTEQLVMNSFRDAKALGVDLGVWSEKTGLLPR